MTLELPWMEPCVFCESMRTKPESWQVLEETQLTLSVLTITQFEVGQSLVISKRHAPTLLDLTAAESLAIIEGARRLMRALIDSLQPLGVLLYQNNGVWSGQEVPHFHLHVVPRQAGSEWGVGPRQVARLEASERGPKRELPAAEALRETAQRIRPSCQSEAWYAAGLAGDCPRPYGSGDRDVCAGRLRGDTGLLVVAGGRAEPCLPEAGARMTMTRGLA